MKKYIPFTIAAVAVLIVAVVLFLLRPNMQPGNGIVWYDYAVMDAVSDLTLTEFPSVRFSISDNRCDITAFSLFKDEVIISGMPIHKCYAADLNGDGYREICAQVSFGSGFIDERIIVYDYHNKKQYVLQDRFISNFALRMEDGILYAQQTSEEYYLIMAFGKLILQDKIGKGQLYIKNEIVNE